MTLYMESNQQEHAGLIVSILHETFSEDRTRVNCSGGNSAEPPSRKNSSPSLIDIFIFTSHSCYYFDKE
jgi:hypothetical protein